MGHNRGTPGGVPREHWDVDDQFARQLGNPAQAAVIEQRWQVFGAAVRTFCAGRSPTGPLRLLDAGCGDGVNLVGLRRLLATLGVEWQLLAVDTSAVRIDRARAADRAGGRIAFGSVTALPFRAASVDVVLCNHVIEHIPAPGDAATEIARVLRPGGLAIVGVPNEGSAMGRLRNHLLQRAVLKETDHVNFFTQTTLSRLLTRAGLAVEAIHPLGFRLPHLRLAGMVRAFPAGRAALHLAGRVLPSQAADLIAVATRRP